MDYALLIQEAASFAFKKEKLVPRFLIYLGYAALLSIPLALFIPIALTGGEIGIENAVDVVLALIGAAGLALMILLISLIEVIVNGAFVENAGEERRQKTPLGKSLSSALQNYPQLVIIAIIVLLIVAIARLIFLPFNLIPIVNLIFMPVEIIVSVAVGLAILFTVQSLMIGKKGIIESIKESVQLFVAKPVETFVAAVITAIISTAIALIAAIPAIITVFAALLAITPEGISWQPLTAISIGAIILSALILLAGIAASNLFHISAITSTYCQLTPRKQERTLKRKRR